MSITFTPTFDSTDVTGFAGECHAGDTIVLVGLSATREAAQALVAEHTALCAECRYYGSYVYAQSDVPEVNVSNSNAAFLLELLGVEFDYCGSIPATELAERIGFASVVGGNDPGTDTIAYRTEGGATMVDCGRSVGYADHRLAQLSEVAAWALAHGREVQWS